MGGAPTTGVAKRRPTSKHAAKTEKRVAIEFSIRQRQNRERGMPPRFWMRRLNQYSINKRRIQSLYSMNITGLCITDDGLLAHSPCDRLAAELVVLSIDL